jgi:hypothetical protein
MWRDSANTVEQCDEGLCFNHLPTTTTSTRCLYHCIAMMLKKMLHRSSGKRGYGLVAPSITITFEYQGNRQSATVAQDSTITQLTRVAATTFGLELPLNLTHIQASGEQKPITSSVPAQEYLYSDSVLLVHQ